MRTNPQIPWRHWVQLLKRWEYCDQSEGRECPQTEGPYPYAHEFFCTQVTPGHWSEEPSHTHEEKADHGKPPEIFKETLQGKADPFFEARWNGLYGDLYRAGLREGEARADALAKQNYGTYPCIRCACDGKKTSETMGARETADGNPGPSSSGLAPEQTSVKSEPAPTIPAPAASGERCATCDHMRSAHQSLGCVAENLHCRCEAFVPPTPPKEEKCVNPFHGKAAHPRNESCVPYPPTLPKETRDHDWCSRDDEGRCSLTGQIVLPPASPASPLKEEDDFGDPFGRTLCHGDPNRKTPPASPAPSEGRRVTLCVGSVAGTKPEIVVSGYHEDNPKNGYIHIDYIEAAVAEARIRELEQELRVQTEHAHDLHKRLKQAAKDRGRIDAIQDAIADEGDRRLWFWTPDMERVIPIKDIANILAPSSEGEP